MAVGSVTFLLVAFDMQKKRNQSRCKELFQRGSVYYMELLKGDTEKKVVDVFHGKNISEDLVQSGFWTNLRGGWCSDSPGIYSVGASLF